MNIILKNLSFHYIYLTFKYIYLKIYYLFKINKKNIS